MTHLPFTLLAYFFNALAVLANKFLLNKTIPDPLIYTFYISAISLPLVFTLPFTKIPSFEVFNLASLSTIAWTLGAYFMFKALKEGQVSRVIPIIGTLIPLILLGVASSTNAVTLPQAWAVGVLIVGMVFLTITDWQAPSRSGTGQGTLQPKELIFEILSAVCFALAYIILREAYLKLDFFSVLIWSRLILFPLVILMFAIPTLRRKIITPAGLRINFLSKEGLVFIGGQLSGAVSEFLLLFSISLANPALVNSLQGTQYAFLFIFSLFLAKKYPFVFTEKLTSKTVFSKLTGIVLIGWGLFSLAR